MYYKGYGEYPIPGICYIISNLALGKHLDAGDVHDHRVSTSDRHDVYCKWIFIASITSPGYYEIQNPFTGMNLDVSRLEDMHHICKRPPNHSNSQLWTPVVGTTRVYFRLANKHLMNVNSRSIFLDFNAVGRSLYCSSNVNDSHASWCLKSIYGSDSSIALSEVNWPRSYESPVKLHCKLFIYCLRYVYVCMHACMDGWMDE